MTSQSLGQLLRGCKKLFRIGGASKITVRQRAYTFIIVTRADSQEISSFYIHWGNLFACFLNCFFSFSSFSILSSSLIPSRGSIMGAARGAGSFCCPMLGRCRRLEAYCGPPETAARGAGLFCCPMLGRCQRHETYCGWPEPAARGAGHIVANMWPLPEARGLL